MVVLLSVKKTKTSPTPHREVFELLTSVILHNGIQRQLNTTTLVENLHGRQPQLKKTSMENDLNGRT